MARKRPESEIVQALKQTRELGYLQCEWVADDRRCRYPGTMTTNTHEGGPWYCRLHFQCDSASYGASVVAASADYRHHTAEEVEAEHLARARAYLKEKGLERRPDESLSQWLKRALPRGKPEVTPKRFEDAA